MGELALQYSLLTAIFTLLLSAACAVVSWRQASAAIRHKKRLSQCETDLLTHESELSRLKEMISRLSKRQSLADYKASVADDETQPDMFRRDKRPGPNASKEQLRNFWLRGRTHQEIAKLAQGGAKE